MKPYLLSWYDFGAYSVLDRATRKKVGYVLGAFKGWCAFLADTTQLDFGTGVVNDIEFTRYATKYRRDAADRVWEASR